MWNAVSIKHKNVLFAEIPKQKSETIPTLGKQLLVQRWLPVTTKSGCGFVSQQTSANATAPLVLFRSRTSEKGPYLPQAALGFLLLKSFN